MRTLARAAAAAAATAVLALAPTATAAADTGPVGAGAGSVGTSAVGAATGNPQLIRAADRIMALPVETFMTVERLPPFNWTTDGCSVPGGLAPYMRLFTPACTLHDFGYRNYGSRAGTLALDPSPARKAAIDIRFLDEMQRICDKERPGPIRHTACYGAAHTYYDAVRLGGGPAFYA